MLAMRSELSGRRADRADGADDDIVASAPSLAEPVRQENAPRPGRERILMCKPDYFAVDYVINPWMENQIGLSKRGLAKRQWARLRRRLSLKADIALIAARPGLPDMAFTANAGLAIGDRVALSRFRMKERRPEEPLFRAWFEGQGFKIAPWPESVAFEGAGDALPDCQRSLIWCGYGWRTGETAPARLERIFQRRTIGLRLVDPRFYHLDTCFCPLSGGWLLYYAQAFDRPSLDAIRRLVPPERRIHVGRKDALSFACNAVEVGGELFLNAASADLQQRLRSAGFTPVVTPLSEFLKAGGAAKCLTLKLFEM